MKPYCLATSGLPKICGWSAGLTPASEQGCTEPCELLFCCAETTEAPTMPRAAKAAMATSALVPFAGMFLDFPSVAARDGPAAGAQPQVPFTITAAAIDDL